MISRCVTGLYLPRRQFHFHIERVTGDRYGAHHYHHCHWLPTPLPPPLRDPSDGFPLSTATMRSIVLTSLSLDIPRVRYVTPAHMFALRPTTRVSSLKPHRSKGTFNFSWFKWRCGAVLEIKSGLPSGNIWLFHYQLLPRANVNFQIPSL